MEEDLIAILLADPGVSGLAGNRVNWNVRPQGEAYPAIVLRRISGGRDYHSTGPSGLVQSRVQVDCIGTSYLSAKGAARAVVDRLSGLSATQGATSFRGAFVDGERDDFDAQGAEKLHQVSVDLLIWHTQ